MLETLMMMTWFQSRSMGMSVDALIESQKRYI